MTIFVLTYHFFYDIGELWEEYSSGLSKAVSANKRRAYIWCDPFWAHQSPSLPSNWYKILRCGFEISHTYTIYRVKQPYLFFIEMTPVGSFHAHPSCTLWGCRVNQVVSRITDLIAGRKTVMVVAECERVRFLCCGVGGKNASFPTKIIFIKASSFSFPITFVFRWVFMFVSFFPTSLRLSLELMNRSLRVMRVARIESEPDSKKRI